MDTLTRPAISPLLYDPRYSTMALSFSPWHGIAAHRPLGSVMRIRKIAYEMSAKFRAEHNGKRILEPRNLDEISA